MKTDHFQSCGHCWVFQICWHIECSAFTASPFSVWNSSTGIPPPPLALFIVMLPEAHLTLHSRMSGSRCVITPCDYLDREDLFCTILLCILATSQCLLLLLGPYHFCPLLCPSLYEMFPGISNFLEEISSLFHSIVFLCFFALITWGRLSYLSLLFFGTLHLNGYIFIFSFVFCFSSFHSYLEGLLSKAFCLFAFLFLGDGLDPCLLYTVMNLRP